MFRLLFDRFFCLRLCILENRFEVSACLPHAQGNGVRAKLAADAYRGGKSIIQAFLFRFLRQLRGNFCGRAVNAELSTVHDQHPVADGKDRVQPMFGQQHRHAELPVDALDGVEKASCRKRVEHARRLVENQKLRIHRHHGREVQHLLLPAR